MRWLRFFRIVNLPTVPGDVLVGVAAVLWGCSGTLAVRSAVAASLASCFVYLFGLADNDLVGAKTDGPERPIPAGEISPGAARIARGLCLFAALAAGALANLPPAWWVAALLLTVAVVAYNRTKSSVLMGLCRGLNVVCGAAAVAVGPAGCVPRAGWFALAAAALVWTSYIAIVTRYSEGEGTDPEKRARVGFLIGAIVYLQLGVLLAAYELAPSLATRNLLLAGAALLVVLRLLKRLLPRVSAS